MHWENEAGVTDQDWMGRSWSDWIHLRSAWVEYDDQYGGLEYIPSEPGIYRVRHRSAEVEGLVYIGQSGNVHRRLIGDMAGPIFDRDPAGPLADEMPYRSPHTAGPCLWAICDAYGPDLEVSFITPEEVQEKPNREGLEDALTAMYRRYVGRSPAANFARMIPGYEQSTYRSRDDASRGHRIEGTPVAPIADDGVGPVPWESVDAVTATDWMGLDWSEPRPLEERTEVAPSEPGIYKLWYRDTVPPLAYIGESANVASRLYTHEKNYGSTALFSFLERRDLDAKPERREIETDLIGAHYLVHDQPPLAQFGQKDSVPP